MSYSEQDVMRGQIIFQIACARGHVPKPAQSDVNKFKDWWDNLSNERREAIFEDCATVLDNSRQKFVKQQQELAKEAPARKWLTGALPAMLALHSIFYAEWWQSILIFFGGVIAFRMFFAILGSHKGQAIVIALNHSPFKSPHPQPIRHLLVLFIPRHHFYLAGGLFNNFRFILSSSAPSPTMA
jgi:hypothetical protein